jgi:sensor histidine kinase YesM
VKIQFQAKKADNYLVVSVRNPFEPNSSSAEGTGFGLSSVERRLYLLFGRTDLLVKKAESDTFSVTLKIPQFL